MAILLSGSDKPVELLAKIRHFERLGKEIVQAQRSMKRL